MGKLLRGFKSLSRSHIGNKRMSHVSKPGSANDKGHFFNHFVLLIPRTGHETLEPYEYRLYSFQFFFSHQHKKQKVG